MAGKIYDTNANKAVCVGCSGAQFSVGYTGVAEIGGQRTDYWLVDQIGETFGSGHEDILTVYKALQERVANAISRLRYKGRLVPPKYRGLTFVLAGYRTINATTVPFLALISNVDLDATDPTFPQSTFYRKGWMFDPGTQENSQRTLVHGARATFTAGDAAANKIREWSPKSSVIEPKLVIRSSCANPGSGLELERSEGSDRTLGAGHYCA